MDEIVGHFRQGRRKQVLLGVTGSGKTFTMARIIAALNVPTLVLSPNKTLAAQLFEEFKGFFPDDRVGYFISYYDYYQPEAFVPQRNLYIAKEVSINPELERLRLDATRNLLESRETDRGGLGLGHLQHRRPRGFPRAEADAGRWATAWSREALLEQFVQLGYKPHPRPAGQRRIPRARPADRDLPHQRGEPAALRPGRRAHRAHRVLRRHHRRRAGRKKAGQHLPDQLLFLPQGAHPGGDRRASASSWRSAWPGSTAGARPTWPSACASAPASTWRCSTSSATARGSRTTPST